MTSFSETTRISFNESLFFHLPSLPTIPSIIIHHCFNSKTKVHHKRKQKVHNHKHNPPSSIMFSLVSKSLLRTTTTTASQQKQRLFHASASQLAKLNVEGLAEKVNLEGQNVLMRVDLNVPLSKEVRMYK